MAGSAFLTGADRGLGFALTTAMLVQGWQVFAGQYMSDWPDLNRLFERFPRQLIQVPLDVSSAESVGAAARQVSASVDSLDVLINNAGVTSPTTGRSIRETQDYAQMHRIYDVNALGPLRMVTAFLPLLERGGLKRLCFVSSEAGSIARGHRTAGYGYTMSKAALNMAVKTLFNDLHPQGYTFRLYHPGWIKSYMGGEKNLQAHLEPEEAAARALPFFLNPLDDEDRLRLIDYEGQEWPW